MEALAAIVALLAAILPPLVTMWARHSALERTRDHALTQHSLRELHVGTERVRKPPAAL